MLIICERLLMSNGMQRFPDLQLMIDKKNIPMNGNYDEEPWDVVKSAEIIQACPPPIANHHRVTMVQQNGNAAKVIPNFNPKINTVGLFNTVKYLIYSNYSSEILGTSIFDFELCNLE